MEKYHFTGIKGSGMSSLAQILFDSGLQVQGSDIQETIFTQVELEKRGIPIYPFCKGNIDENTIVILGNAFPDTHQEVIEANSLGIEVVRYHQFLKRYIGRFRSIGVSGTHGKTSTTSLLSHVIGGVRPLSYLIGDGTGKGVEGAEYFAFEACEYRRHFLAYSPDYAIVTNIEFDHPDYFKNLSDVKEAFCDYVGSARKAIVCGDDKIAKSTLDKFTPLFYGYDSDNDLIAKNVITDSRGTSFEVEYRDESLGEVTINQYGDHHVYNSLSVIAVCLLEGLSLDEVAPFFSSFKGAKRRFQVEEFNGSYIVDDYAHHPTEISATIESAKKKFKNKEIIAIFQPHTYSRTKKFANEFTHSLSAADHVYGCPIFGSAREIEGDTRIEDILKQIPGSKTITPESIRKLKQHHGGVFLFMGAGDVKKYIDAYKLEC